MDVFYNSTVITIFFFFFLNGEFQLMVSTLNNNSLLSKQDTNQFFMYA